MASRHWNPKTGRGRWNNNVSSTAVAKRIVKKAGPMDRRFFTDTDRTAAIQYPRIWITASTPTSYGITTLFSSADFEELQVSHKERVRVNSVKFQPMFHANTAADNVPLLAVRTIRWWMFWTSPAIADDLILTGDSPWDDSSPQYAQRANIINLRRGMFQLTHMSEPGTASTSALATGNASNYGSRKQVRSLNILLKRKQWIVEGQQLYFAFQSWTHQIEGLPAEIGAVIGSIDTLIRWARY